MMKKFIYMAIAALLFMSFLGTAVHAANDVLFDKIQTAVKENLLKSVSEKIELEELRIVKGAEYFGAGSADMSIQNLYIDGYSGRNKVVYAVYLKDRKNTRTVGVVVEASYDVFADVYVTSRSLAKGEILSDGDYYAVRQKLSRLPAGAITSKKDIVGKMLKVSVTDGVIIRSNYLVSALTVKKGKKIDLIVEGTSVTISAKGTLRSDANIGETANVTCDLTRKELSGILISPTLLRVKI